MRELVRSYLENGLNRRGFVERMAKSGFSALAANSVLASLAPAFAQDSSHQEESKSYTRTFRGTGGELLAEQLKDAGVEYLFLGNGTGVSPLCDAVVDRPDMKIVLAVHEALCVAMADGYSRASGKTAFSMFSRVGVTDATFSPDDQRVATVSTDSTARVWDAVYGRQIAVLVHPDVLWGAAFSPDGRTLATVSRDGTVRTWDISPDGQSVGIVRHPEQVIGAAFSPDGNRIVTASFDGTAVIWDLEG